MRSSLVRFGLRAAVLLALPTAAVGQEEEPRQLLPITMRMDRERVETRLFMEAPVQSLDLVYEDLGSPHRNEAVAAFLKVTSALAAGDVNQAARFHLAEEFDATTGEQAAQVYIEGFKDAWPSLQVLRAWDLGAETDIVWQLDTGQDVPFRRITRIATQPARLGQDRFWLESLQPQGQSLVRSVLAASEQTLAVKNQGTQDLAAADELEHAIDHPGRPIKWHFDGLTTSFNAIAEKPTNVPQSPAAEFYHRAMLDLRSGDPARYQRHFTDYSAQKFATWAAQMPAGGYQQFVDDMVKEGRHVVFVLEASPLSLFFYQTPDGRLHQDFVVEEKLGEFRLTNFFVRGHFSSLLAEPSLFLDPILRPLFGEGPDAPPPLFPPEPPAGPTTVSAPLPGALPRSKTPTPYLGDDSNSVAATQSAAKVVASDEKATPAADRPLSTVLIAILAAIGLFLLFALFKFLRK